jgi:hypothetical protein
MYNLPYFKEKDEEVVKQAALFILLFFTQYIGRSLTGAK